MMAQRTVEVAIIGDASSLQRALRQGEGSAATFQSRMQALSSRLSTIGASLTRNLTLPLLGFGVVAYRELSESQRVMGSTEAVIRSMGLAAQVTLDDVEAMTTELRDLSGLDDEGIQEMINTLLTFRDVVPIIDEASLAALDMSTLFQGDMQRAAVQVGRALQDPVRGLTALSRVGVTFTQQQREQIAAMVAFGDAAGAQRIILEALQAQVGGQASAFGQTVGGQLGLVRQQFEDLAASILTDLLPVLEDLAGVLSKTADAYGGLSEGQQQAVAGGLALGFVAGPLAKLFAGLVIAIKAVAVVAGVLGAALGISASAMAAIIVLAAGVVAGLVWIIMNWGEGSRAAGDFFRTILMNAGPVRGVIIAIGQAVSIMVQWVKNAAGMVVDLFSALKRLAGVVLSPLIDAVRGLASMLSSALGPAESLFNRLRDIAGLNLSKAGLSVPTPKAAGGPVDRGGSFLVGEKGPELFIPRSSGRIVPNHKLGRSGGSAPEMGPVSVDDLARALARQPLLVKVVN
jgi:hypothetical protein